MKKILYILLFLPMFVYGQVFTHHYYSASVAVGGSLVAVDTLGWYTPSYVSSNSISNAVIVCRDTASSSGTLDSLYAYKWTDGDSINICIYADDANYPGDLLGQTGNVLFPGSGEWNGYPLVSNVNIVSGSVYWIGYHGSVTTKVVYSNIGTSVQNNSVDFQTGLIDPFTASLGTSTRKLAIYGRIKE